jgi:hypothetical protein
MILVVASSVVMLGVRHGLSDFADSLGWRFRFALHPDRAEWLIMGRAVVGLVLMVASIFLLILRARRPRPSIRHVMRQPGTVACFFVVAYFLMDQGVQTVSRLVAEMFHPIQVLILPQQATLSEEFTTPGYVVWSYLTPYNYEFPCLVATAWLALRLGRIGRPESGWIDRSGRAVGWSWIAWGISGAFL